MGNIFHEDFEDFILALNKFNVEYMIIGGYAVILNGYNRTTGDLDIWVKKTRDNYRKLITAFGEFGLSIFDMTEENFLNNPRFDVFSFGRSPVSIDLLTKVKGLEFDESYAASKLFNVEGISVQLIDFRDLIKSKKASGRAKDIDDIENLSAQDKEDI